MPWDLIISNADTIIQRAASSPLGILALVILVLAIIAVVFFGKATTGVKVGVFAALFIGFLGMAGALALSTQTFVAEATADDPCKQLFDAPIEEYWKCRGETGLSQ